MTEKSLNANSFSVNKVAGLNGEPGPVSRLIPQWLRNWRTPDVLLRLVSPIVLLLLWELASELGLIPQRIIAAPSQIGGTLWAMIISGELGKHLWVSLQRALLGLSIGVSIGVVAALITGLSKRGEVILDSPMQMLRTIPSLALVPLFILWFGIGEFTKIALIVTGTTFPVYLNLFAGIRNIDPKLIEAANTLGLSRRELIWHVILPGSLPSFLSACATPWGFPGWRWCSSSKSTPPPVSATWPVMPGTSCVQM